MVFLSYSKIFRRNRIFFFSTNENFNIRYIFITTIIKKPIICIPMCLNQINYILPSKNIYFKFSLRNTF